MSASGVHAFRGAQATIAADRMGKEVMAVAEQFKNCSLEQRMGRVFEPMIAGSLNVNAANAGLGVDVVHTTHSTGMPHSPADIVDKLGGNPIQTKVRGNPASALRDLSKPKYTGMQKVMPSDHAGAGKVLADKVVATRPPDSLNYDNYKDTANNIADRAKKDGIRSDAFTSSEVERAAQNPAEFAKAAVLREIGGAALKGGVLSGAVGGSISMINAAKKYYKGEMTADQALSHAGMGTAKSALGGASQAAVASLIGQAAPALGECGGAVALAGGAVQQVVLLGKFLKGDIKKEKLGKDTAKNVLTTGVGWAAFELGTLAFAWTGPAAPVFGVAASILTGFGLNKIVYSKKLCTDATGVGRGR